MRTAAGSLAGLAPDRRRPVHWSWRPLPAGPIPDTGPGPLLSGAAPCPGIEIFHDADEADGSLRVGPDGLELSISAFDGSYLSIAIELPSPSLALLTDARLFEAALTVRQAPARAAWLRLNLGDGPRTLRSVSALGADREREGCHATIDLAAFAHSGSPRRAWVEIIFDCAGKAAIAIPEAVFWLAPRGRF